MKIKITAGVRIGGESVKPGTVAEVADAVGYDLIQRAKAEAVVEKKSGEKAETAEPKKAEKPEPKKAEDPAKTKEGK